MCSSRITLGRGNFGAVRIKYSAKIPYPVLDDHTGQVGKSYGAKTTPHMFIVDASGKITYDGAIDNDPTGKREGDVVNYVDAALTEVLSGKPVSTTETKAYGCTVKYAN